MSNVGGGRTPRTRRYMHMPVVVRLPEPMLAQIDSIAASRPDQPDRSSLLRQLLADGLASYRRKTASATAAVSG